MPFSHSLQEYDHDQDALNGVLYDKTKHVLPQWNMTSIVYAFQLNKRGDRINGKLVNGYIEEKRNAKKFLKNPPVLHYVSKPKPWQNGCYHPFSYLYFKYAKKTIHFAQIKSQCVLSYYYAILKHSIIERLSAVKQMVLKTDKTRY